jgi:class 3 adenylate cyclase
MNNSRNRSSEAVLAKYFDPYLLQLLQNPAILELKDSCLTTVFWDISNFSRLCNKLMKNPEAVTAFLKEYFNEAMDIIRSHRGILDKFIGDGILAYFGYIDDAPDCGAFNATMAAIELREIQANKILLTVCQRITSKISAVSTSYIYECQTSV